MIPIRLPMSEEEQAFIAVMSTKAMVSPSEYVRACLDEPDGRLNAMGALRANRYLPSHDGKRKKREICVRVTEEQHATAKKWAEKSRRNWRTWVRMRVLGESPKALKREVVKKVGRPSEMEKFRAEMAESGGAMRMASRMNSHEGLKVFYQSVFSLLKRAGVREGDEEALYETLKRIISYEVRQVATDRVSGPNEVAPTMRQIVVRGYSVRHGFVELVEPPPEERRRRSKLGKQDKTLRL